ncbi:hypothetical protein F8388_025774 [Cannabis sativa]|uniref:Uncharacterized protein n=1 Tax=Cannabis sativa TaxID=3483 RepID=A0A7J6EH07_CANSA|nr:hypothetical protein G4B88_023196 [Cannabis sativa]KAF4367356.1 hypothetical protein F8388_025774 [Cannabis sativa]
MFRGKEASRASALLSFKPQDMNDSLDDLGADELHVLEDKFIHKYPKLTIGREEMKVICPQSTSDLLPTLLSDNPHLIMAEENRGYIQL